MKLKFYIKSVSVIAIGLLGAKQSPAQTPGPSGLYATYTDVQAHSMVLSGIANGTIFPNTPFPLNGLRQVYIPATKFNLMSGLYFDTLYSGPNGTGIMISAAGNPVGYSEGNTTSMSGPSFLPPGITGRMVRANGQPVENCTINVYLNSYTAPVDQIRTDANGTYLYYYTAVFPGYNKPVTEYTFASPGTYYFSDPADQDLTNTQTFIKYFPNTTAGSTAYYTTRIDLGSGVYYGSAC